MAHTDTRADGARRIIVGIVAIPYNVLVILLALLLAIPFWLINGLWQVIRGKPLLAENSRIGYVLYTAQGNIQAVVAGRGELRWWFFTR